MLLAATTQPKNSRTYPTGHCTGESAIMLIKYEFEVRASAKFLFDLTQNYDLRAKWDPLTTEAFLVNATEAAQGELVRCTAANGLSMDTVYVSYKPN